MRRSLLLRLLALSLTVALGAVAATALLATYGTTEHLQGELDSSASLLEADQLIFAELTAYAGDHDSWRDVAALLDSLADRTGRRVALTTPEGSVIADSARKIAGGGQDLPSMPAATIDVASPSAGTPGAVSVATRVDGEPTGGSSGGTIRPLLGSSDWRLTGAERSRRATLVQVAASCLRRAGVKVEIVRGPSQLPELSVQRKVTTGSGHTVIELPADDELESHRCMRPGLRAPSAAALRVNRDEEARSIECLTKAGLAYRVTSASLDGMRQVVSREGTKQSAAFTACVDAARTAALRPYVAPPARLYLGSADRFNVFTVEGLLRTMATALGVLLIAALVTVLAGRRLLRPILALTGAARQMTAGDRAARVPVTGHDEVARLGHAFNAMAQSIERNEQQRRAMVSDVAHELRTPLSNIKGYLEASEDGVVPLDRVLVGSLLEETALLERLVSDLQELALAEAGMLRLHPEPDRDLAEVAQQAVAAHRAQADAAGVSLRLADTQPAIGSFDPARIRQALGNLVANAVKFTPAGGTVEVSVRARDGSNEVVVADTGQGIAAEHLPHLFDRFYRADPSRSRTTGGSGLGLAITKHLVEAHGGRVEVTSTPGRGSVFTIGLPATTSSTT